MESQPAWRQRCGMHCVPWRDNGKGLCGHAGVEHMRKLPQRSGGTTEVRSVYGRQDMCELSSSTHLRGAQEGSSGRQVTTTSRRHILELLAGSSAPTALETWLRLPSECTTDCSEDQQMVRPALRGGGLHYSRSGDRRYRFMLRLLRAAAEFQFYYAEHFAFRGGLAGPDFELAGALLREHFKAADDC